MKIAVGAWLSNDLVANEREISNLIDIAKAGQADMLIVGSEVLLRGDLTESQLIEYISRVKQAAPGIPVTTADVYSQFMTHKAVVAAVDVIMANYFPYWEGIEVGKAVPYVHMRHKELVEKLKGKRLLFLNPVGPAKGNHDGQQFLRQTMRASIS